MTLQTDLFSNSVSSAPLAYQARPTQFEDFKGQKQAVDFLLKQRQQDFPHIILWGPPGTGKTTLANLLAQQYNWDFATFNAVLNGVPELRKLIQSILEKSNAFQKRTLLFIDEIHRFNKSQQDALLPHLEKGDFILIGATTEYPQTSLNKAILSRVRTLELKKLSEENIQNIIYQALSKLDKTCPQIIVNMIAKYANGDARYALNFLQEFLSLESDLNDLSEKQILETLTHNSRQYDRNSDRHYDVISAFIKSIRGSDPDAAILWLAIMLDGGEDPAFIARRLVILSSEDIGNASPQALNIATSCLLSVQQIGMPEARIILAQTTIYLASCPKSNASYMAIDSALEYVRSQPTIEVPGHIRSVGPEKKNYLYPHSYPQNYVEQAYMPKSVTQKFYNPTDNGFEKQIQTQLKK